MFLVVDEFSRYPFAFACSNMTSSTVIHCLGQLFCLFGHPQYVHSDRGSSFMSHDLKKYLSDRGIASSKSSPYHPTGNSQCERVNQTVWRTIKLLLHTYKQPESCWEVVLPEALHAVRSLLCTATNSTPHERFLGFERRSMFGRALPSWLIQPGPVLLRRFVRNKNNPLVEEVELLEANQSFAHVRFPSGRESSVSTTDLAPSPRQNVIEGTTETISTQPASAPTQLTTQPASTQPFTQPASVSNPPTTQSDFHKNSDNDCSNFPSTREQFEQFERYSNSSELETSSDSNLPRRSTRVKKFPTRYGNNIYDT